jgi:hypothetical protein
MAVGFPTKANWAAGDVLTASAQDDLAGTVNLLSNASAASGSVLLSNVAGTSFTYSPLNAAAKNILINGGMDIWQRGTSFTGNAYFADRWFCANASAGSGQESTIVPSGYRYSLKITTSALVPYITQPIETANAIQFAGQNVTFSAYVYTSVSATTQIDVQYSTSTDNPQAGTWTTITATSGGTGATTTAFSRVSGVFAIPSTAKSLNVRIYTTAVLTGSIYVSGAQLELGVIPTTFSRAGGNIQGELAACQRYYWRATSVANFAQYGGNPAYDTANLFVAINLPVTMRVAPSILDTSATSTFTCENSSAVSATALTSLSLNTNSNPNIGVVTVVKTASFTSGLYYKLISNSTTSGYIGFSGEL